MTVVYVLISDINDFYPEMALVSMYSLRMHNPDAKIICVTDKKTFDTLTGNRDKLKHYVDVFIKVDIPAGYNNVEKSRYLKTSLPQYVKEDFLYIDNDTIIKGNLNELDDNVQSIASVYDAHKPGCKNHGQIKYYMEKTGFSAWNFEKYYNGGVLLVRYSETMLRFFESWHYLWKEDNRRYKIEIDQPSFARTNIKYGNIIAELDGLYNCQVMFPEAKQFFFTAKIIHYHTSVDLSHFFPLNNSKILSDIRKYGITSNVERIIENPIEILLYDSIILIGEQKKYYLSPTMILANKLTRDYPWTNKIARLAYRIFGYKI